MPQFVEGERLNSSGLTRRFHQALGAVLFPLLAIVRKYERVSAALITHSSDELGFLCGG